MGLAVERGFQLDWLDFRRLPLTSPSYKGSTRKVTGIGPSSGKGKSLRQLREPLDDEAG